MGIYKVSELGARASSVPISRPVPDRQSSRSVRAGPDTGSAELFTDPNAAPPNRPLPESCCGLLLLPLELASEQLDHHASLHRRPCWRRAHLGRLRRESVSPSVDLSRARGRTAGELHRLASPSRQGRLAAQARGGKRGTGHPYASPGTKMGYRCRQRPRRKPAAAPPAAPR